MRYKFFSYKFISGDEFIGTYTIHFQLSEPINPTYFDIWIECNKFKDALRLIEVICK